MNTNITTGEINTLIKSFRKLKRLIDSALPKKRKRLWEKAKEKAAEDLKKELKLRADGLTLRPRGNYRTLKKSTKAEEERTKKQINDIIERTAEKIYCSLDQKYGSKVTQRETKANKLVAEIDHVVTALKEDLVKFPQAKDTILFSNWKELRRTVSTKDIIKLNEQEHFDRAIKVLGIIKGRLKKQQSRKVIATIGRAFLRWWKGTVLAFFTALFNKQ